MFSFVSSSFRTSLHSTGVIGSLTAKGFLISAAALLLLATTAHAEKQREVVVGISEVYVPSGFDSGSDVFVVVQGLYPNGCYSWSRAETSHEGENLHTVKSHANVSQGMCIMAMIPFNEEVQLGRLDSGTHTVRFVSGDGTYLEKKIEIQ